MLLRYQVSPGSALPAMSRSARPSNGWHFWTTYECMHKVDMIIVVEYPSVSCASTSTAGRTCSVAISGLCYSQYCINKALHHFVYVRIPPPSTELVSTDEYVESLKIN